jgi:hypothetical protein
VPTLPRPSRLVPSCFAAVAALGLAACSAPVNVEAAPDAANPVCAEMMVVLPAELSGHAQRKTNSQATSAWGDPAAVVLRCGVQVPGPSTDPCVSVNGVDWLAHEGGDAWTLTTYGRTPATEVVFDPNVVPSSNVLAELAPAAGRIPAEGGCTSVDQQVDLP